MWTWARTLEDGIALAGEASFDAILLDLTLPDSPPNETVLRLSPAAAGVPVIVLTAQSDVEVALRAVRDGAEDYLVKTQLSSELLLRTIRYAIERSRHSAEVDRMNRLLSDMNGLLSEELQERKQVQEALRLMNATLEARVDERTRELLQANQSLEARNKELAEFTFAASHDLQEPLRKVATFAGLLEAEYQPHIGETGLHYLQRSRLSRVMSKGIPFTTVDLGRTLAEALEQIEVLIRISGGRVEAEPLPRVEGDPVQLKQLLLNLVSNGLKFQRAGEPPVVRVSGSADEVDGRPLVRLAVEDNGIGFDLKYLDKIFMPFRRLHGKDTYEGTGMGLAICRRIVERHGGEIRAESTPGAGSRFTVLLPQKSPPAERPQPS